MKFLKWFSLFFVLFCAVLILGIGIGFKTYRFFYPGTDKKNIPIVQNSDEPDNGKKIGFVEEMEKIKSGELTVAVSQSKECINADTVYLCREKDLYTGDEVVIASQAPHLYMGMDRNQYLECMEEYEKNPPLSERERGFVSLEVLRFSASEVEVLMNYDYVKPSESFYLVIYDGDLVVLLDDRQTVYMQTGINVLDLPEHLQQEIMQGMYVPDEQSLYDFLETYTS